MPARLIRWSGLAAMLGGLLWIAFAVRLAALPEGCISAACELPGRTMRPLDSVVAALFLAAGVCTALAVTGLLLRAQAAGALGRLGQVGLLLLGVGTLLVVTALLIQQFLYGGDFPRMPVFIIPGGLALVLGFLLVAVFTLRAGTLPRWVSALLLIGTLSLLGFNEQNAQALQAIPFGLAWIGVGYALWSGRSGQPYSPAALDKPASSEAP